MRCSRPPCGRSAIFNCGCRDPGAVDAEGSRRAGRDGPVHADRGATVLAKMGQGKAAVARARKAAAAILAADAR